MTTLLVTGGAGFIGANFIRYWLATHPDDTVVNLDLLTYAGHLPSLAGMDRYERYHFVHGDIADRQVVTGLFERFDFDVVVHFAAESHVDRSIRQPEQFVKTNVLGTFVLLDVAREYWAGGRRRRFVHISTDEVFGSLQPGSSAFTEATPYAPNSPYSASKAASDHFARAYWHTYGLPVITTHCSNNYGPYQFPEKLIPLMILNALAGQALPVYGDGGNIRDWLYVEDHCRAIATVIDRGRPGECYNIGGGNERTNLELVQRICDLLDELRPKPSSYRGLITFVEDRPGHDFRYAIDARKIAAELGWQPQYDFESGLRATVQWYLDHPQWCAAVRGSAGGAQR